MSKSFSSKIITYLLIFSIVCLFNIINCYGKSYNNYLSKNAQYFALNKLSKNTSFINDDEFANDEFDNHIGNNYNVVNNELIKDPLEHINRKFFVFSMWVDNNIISYVSDAYIFIVPSPIRISFYNALTNFNEPLVAANHLLQFKFVSFAKTALRFLLNSTLGFFGTVDIASKLNLPPNYNDLGYTLNYYHVGNGIFFFIPLLGPYTLTSAIGNLGSSYMYLYTIKLVNDVSTSSILKIQTAGSVTTFLNTRASVHTFIENSFDPYAFIKSAYVQNRQFTFSQLKNSW